MFTRYLCLAADHLGSAVGPDETRDLFSAPPVIVALKIFKLGLIITIADISDAKHWISETSQFRRPLIY
jgi:hypothetical protein